MVLYDTIFTEVDHVFSNNYRVIAVDDFTLKTLFCRVMVLGHGEIISRNYHMAQPSILLMSSVYQEYSRV